MKRSYPNALAQFNFEKRRRPTVISNTASRQSSIRISRRSSTDDARSATINLNSPGQRRTIRIRLRNEGELKKPHQRYLDEQQEQEEQEEQEEQDADNSSPLRGWRVLHDALLDPETQSMFEVLGVEHMHVLGQSSYDPEAEESGIIDVSRVLRGVASNFPDGLEGYVELDWEDPFFSILHQGPSHPRFEEVRDMYVDLLRRFKIAFPNVRISHYNIPYIPFYVQNSDGRVVWWVDIDDETRAQYNEELDALRPILDEMDWFCPRFYDFVPTNEFPEESRAARVAAEIGHRTAIVTWLKEYIDSSDKPDREIIPVTRIAWEPGVSGYESFSGELIPKDEFINEQVLPAMQSGAHGVLLWQGSDLWMLNIAFTDPVHVSPELREMAHRYFRRIGVLGEDELPNWSSAAQKRAFLSAISDIHASYIPAIATQMRSGEYSPGVATTAEGSSDTNP